MVRAAVLSSPGHPVEIVDDVELDSPRAGEIRIRVGASGVCHTDLSIRDGVVLAVTPIVLGHEGAGEVVEVGPDVEGLAVGDHVVVSWVPQCGACFFCVRGQGHLCKAADVAMTGACLLDGTTRLSRGGRPVHQLAAAGTFATEAVIPASGAVRVPDDLDLVHAALIGCGVLTGVGAALHTARIAEGDTVAVIGCGGVGLNVIQGARVAGAGEIIAIDTNPAALELAEAMGATVLVNASSTRPVSEVQSRTGERGADVTFEVIGLQQTIDQAVAMTRRGGQTVLVGLPAMTARVQVPALLGLVMAAKSITGCWYGSANVHQDVPLVLDLVAAGKLQLDPLVSQLISLDDVESAFDVMRRGAAARTVITFDPPFSA